MSKLICFLFGLAALGACSSRDAVNSSLERAVAGGAEFISLQDHTDFDWDTVYVYGPYAPFSDINIKHKLSLRAQRKYEGDFVSEGDCLYVFIQSGKAVRTSFGPRRCSGILVPGVYSSEEAVFGIKRNGYSWDLVALGSNNRLEQAVESLARPAAAQP